MESLLKLRRRHLVKDEPISAIARDLNLARNTVKKYLKAEIEPVYQRSHQPCPKLGTYRQQLETWLAQDGQRPKAAPPGGCTKTSSGRAMPAPTTACSAS